MINFASSSKVPDKKSTAQVFTWVREHLLNTLLVEDPNLQIIVQEMRCNEPDCVPIETLIMLLSAVCNAATSTTWRWSGKILKPVAEVKELDVQLLSLPISMNSIDESDSVDDTDSAAVESQIENESEKQFDISKTNDVPHIPSTSTETETKSITHYGKTAPKSVFRVASVDPVDHLNSQKEQHKKGVRARGCPCCDPDNLDNILDQFMFNSI